MKCTVWLVAILATSMADVSNPMLQSIHRIVFALHQENMEYLTMVLNENPEKRLSREEIGMITSHPVKRRKLLEFLEVACPKAVIVHETLYGEYLVVDAPIWVGDNLSYDTILS